MNEKGIFMKLPYLVFAAFIGLTGITASAHTHEGTDGDAMDASDVSTGVPGKLAQAHRTIAIEMNDAMTFTPRHITVKQGQTVRFKLKNVGAVEHELFLGSKEAIEAHRQMMVAHPGMHHEEPNVVTLAPGQTGQLIWKFSTAGTVNMACLQPGHFEAGMNGTITVVKVGAGSTQ